MKKFLLAAAVLVGIAPSAFAQHTPYPLGVFVSGPEYGPAALNEFDSFMGVSLPAVTNLYMDGTQTALPNTGSASYNAGDFASGPHGTRTAAGMAVVPSFP